MAGGPSVAVDVAPSYRISLERAGEGAAATWVADVEGLPGCSARGATPEEAVRRAWAAVEESHGLAPAEPKHSGKLLVRMPATLHDELARVAEAEGVSLNQFITGALASSVEWRARERAAAGAEPRQLGITRAVLLANLAVVLLAALVALTLLVAAWRS